MQAKLLNEGKLLGILLLIVFIVLKIVFHASSFGVVLRITFGLFWLFFIPGYFLLYSLPSLSGIEKSIMSFIVGSAFYGAVAYNFGLMGMPFSVQVFVVPVLGILIGAWFLLKK